ncbi:hypothetical protein MTO96_010160 [Rhipicephalus appendiculatus]
MMARGLFGEVSKEERKRRSGKVRFTQKKPFVRKFVVRFPCTLLQKSESSRTERSSPFSGSDASSLTSQQAHDVRRSRRLSLNHTYVSERVSTLCSAVASADEAGSRVDERRRRELVLSAFSRHAQEAAAGVADATPSPHATLPVL